MRQSCQALQGAVVTWGYSRRHNGLDGHVPSMCVKEAGSRCARAILPWTQKGMTVDQHFMIRAGDVITLLPRIYFPPCRPSGKGPLCA